MGKLCVPKGRNTRALEGRRRVGFRYGLERACEEPDCAILDCRVRGRTTYAGGGRTSACAAPCLALTVPGLVRGTVASGGTARRGTACAGKAARAVQGGGDARKGAGGVGPGATPPASHASAWCVTPMGGNRCGPVWGRPIRFLLHFWVRGTVGASRCRLTSPWKGS
jgi:hypothetical protein